MEQEKRKSFNTTIRLDLLRRLKMLAAEQDKRVNDILEELIEEHLKKLNR